MIAGPFRLRPALDEPQIRCRCYRWWAGRTFLGGALLPPPVSRSRSLNAISLAAHALTPAARRPKHSSRARALPTMCAARAILGLTSLWLASQLTCVRFTRGLSGSDEVDRDVDVAAGGFGIN